MKCPECQSENPDHRKFCYECGAKLSHVCPECGAENLLRDKFCGECGHALAEPKPIDYTQPQSYTPKFLADRILTSRSAIEGERLEGIERQVESANQKPLALYAALETGKLDLDDLAPRIKDLRAEQTRLQRARDEDLAELEATEPKELDREAVLRYVQDLKEVLAKGTFMEQKAFLKSFIKRIEFEPVQVAFDYTIPVSTEKDRSSEREVLSIRRFGSPIITFPHQKVETFFEVAIAHTPQGGRSESWHKEALHKS